MHLGTKRFCAGVFCIAALALLVSGLTNAEPRWPQYGFNARHTLFNPFEQTLNRSNVADVSLQWEFMTGNGTGIAPLSGPALADGVLYVASMAQTTFTALDADLAAALIKKRTPSARAPFHLAGFREQAKLDFSVAMARVQLFPMFQHPLLIIGMNPVNEFLLQNLCRGIAGENFDRRVHI